MSIKQYRTLGRTGLRISPLAFGAGTFGATWGDGWSIEKEDAKAIFNAFLDGGMNHIDTADVYQAGESEKWIGEFIKDRGQRDAIVLATKFTMSTDENDANAGGNGRKHVIKAVEQSLKRLQTDYIDILYAHHWDTVTPVDELMRVLDDLVRQGKTRYVALSNFPAWYLGEAHVLSQWHGWEKLAAIQMEYNLLERTIENEFVPFAHHSGMGILAWSPLANGLLTGKYTVNLETKQLKGDGRIAKSWVTDPFVDPFSEATYNTIETLKKVSQELHATPAQTALAWILHQPGFSGVVTGASKVSQVEANLAALELSLSEDQVTRLKEASKPPVTYPYGFHAGFVQDGIHGVHELPRKIT